MTSSLEKYIFSVSTVLTPEQFLTQHDGEKIEIALAKLASESDARFRALTLRLNWQQAQLKSLYGVIRKLRKRRNPQNGHGRLRQKPI